MKVLAKAEIKITKAQSASIISAVQSGIRDTLCELFNSAGAELSFNEILDEALEPEGIEIQSDEEIEIKDSVTYTIILNDVERKKLRAVQEKIWREGIDAEMSIDAVVEKVVTATLEFLTVKVLDEPLARMIVARRET
jgi:hypothetical protein